MSAIRHRLPLEAPFPAVRELPEPRGPTPRPDRARRKRHPPVRGHSAGSPLPLTHLQRLEAESIHIFREVLATADNPVLLYSIGKDSAVLLHLAIKAFYPAPLPFPLLHVDTTWKFREMIEFRDRRAKELGCKLIVHINQDGLRAGVNPFTSGSRLHTDVMKTQALKQALDHYKFDAAFGGARRDEEKSRAKERVFSLAVSRTSLGPEEPAPRTLAPVQHPQASRRKFPRLSAVELDRGGRLGLHRPRRHPGRSALFRRPAPSDRA